MHWLCHALCLLLEVFLVASSSPNPSSCPSELSCKSVGREEQGPDLDFTSVLQTQVVVPALGTEKYDKLSWIAQGPLKGAAQEPWHVSLPSLSIGINSDHGLSGNTAVAVFVTLGLGLLFLSLQVIQKLEYEEHEGIKIPKIISFSFFRRLSESTSNKEIPSGFTKLFAATLVALSAVAFSLYSTFTNSISSDTTVQRILAYTFFRFSLPWIFLAAALCLSGTNPFSNFFDKDIIVRSALNTTAVFTEVYTLTHLQLVDATIIMFTNPIVTAILSSIMLNETWRRSQKCLAALSFIGVVVSCSPWQHRERSSLVRSSGIIAGIVYSLSVATMNVWNRLKFRNSSTVQLIHHYLFVGTLLSAVILALFAGNKSMSLLHFEVSEHAGSVIGCAIGVVIGELACTKGFQISDPGFLSAIRNIDIVLVFIWQAVFLKQRISMWSGLGAMLVGISTYGLIVPWLFN